MSRRTLYVGIGAVVVVVAASVAVIANSRHAEDAARRLATELAMARSEGLPVTEQDLEAKYPWPSGEDAAPLYDRATSRLDAIQRRYRDLPAALKWLSQGRATTDELALIRSFLADSAAPLTDIAEASKLPRCDLRPYPRLRDKSSLALRLVDASKALDARSRLLAEQGKLFEAYEDVQTIGRLGQHVAEGHQILNVLPAHLIDAVGLAALKEVLTRSSMKPDALAKAWEAAKAFEGDMDGRSVVETEFVRSYSEVSAFRTTGDVQAATAYQRRVSGLKAVRDAMSAKGQGPALGSLALDEYKAKLLSAYRSVFRALGPGPTSLLDLKRALKAAQSGADRDGSEPNAFARAFLDSAVTFSTELGRAKLTRNLAETSIRVMQDRLRFGHYPSSLAAYGATATDPQTGFKFAYTTSGDGFKVGGMEVSLVPPGH